MNNNEQRRLRYQTDPEYRETVKARSRAYRERRTAAQVERSRQVNAAHAAKPQSRASRRARRIERYGLTVREFDRMLAAQGGGCAICGGPPKGKGTFHIDHDHETGRVRGLLCLPCNATLGFMNDDPERLRKAAGYLDGNTEEREATGAAWSCRL